MLHCAVVQSCSAWPGQRISLQLGDERVRGSHHIFTRNDVMEILNLQPRGGQAKPYQVKQVRGVIVSYRLAGEAVEQASEAADEDTADGTNNEGEHAE